MPPQLLLNAQEDEEARLIETRLEGLAIERSNLLRQLNTLRAKTRAIPPEILSQIFIISATPLRLGAVCSLWREIAWSTPDLWATIKCNPKRRPQRNVTDASLYLLRLFFKNSGQLKVAVELINMGRWHMPSDQPETICEAMTAITAENQHRIRALVLKSSHPWDARIWKVVHPFFQTQHFPHLENLHLAGCNTARLELQNAPHLREFSLSGVMDVNWPTKQPYWNQITVVRLRAALILHCVQLLLLPPPQLEVFECVGPIYSQIFSAASTIMRKVTILPHLINFEWTGKEELLQEFMWKAVRLPAIRKLTWNCPGTPVEISVDLQQSFFRRLTTLEALKIQQYHSINELRVVWECLDSLSELELDACKLEKDGVDIMNVLTLLDDPNHQNLLPNLKKLRIDVLIGRGISRMLHSRRDGLLSMGASRWRLSSRLEQAMIYTEDMVYEPGEQEVIRALVDGGLQLDIIVGDERVRWS